MLIWKQSHWLQFQRLIVHKQAFGRGNGNGNKKIACNESQQFNCSAIIYLQGWNSSSTWIQLQLVGWLIEYSISGAIIYFHSAGGLSSSYICCTILCCIFETFGLLGSFQFLFFFYCNKHLIKGIRGLPKERSQRCKPFLKVQTRKKEQQGKNLEFQPLHGWWYSQLESNLSDQNS